MTLFLKRKGSVRSLSSARPREAALVAEIEALVEADPYRGGLLAELIAACRARAAQSANDASWPFLLGRFLMAGGEAEEAREALRRASMLDPRDPRIALHRAIWHQAALFAACGLRENIEMPDICGPSLSADGTGFAAVSRQHPPQQLLLGAIELLDEAARYRLPPRDRADIAARRARLDALLIPPALRIQPGRSRVV